MRKLIGDPIINSINNSIEEQPIENNSEENNNETEDMTEDILETNSVHSQEIIQNTIQEVDSNPEEDEMDEEGELSSEERAINNRMEGIFGSSSDFHKFKSILSNLKNDSDPTMQLISLQELAEILSMSNEDDLAGTFPSISFAKELIRIMKGSTEDVPLQSGEMYEDMMLALAMSEGMSGGNPEIMLLACRCVTNLLEAMPTVVGTLLSFDAVAVLCQKLKSIEYIDLAEQALYALEKISSQVPRAVVNEGGLEAVLMYFDFFGIHVQRTALRIASSCLRSINSESFSKVMEIIPTLMNTITYTDRSVVELTCLCWVRISESYRSNRECLERAITVDLLEKLIRLIPVSGNTNTAYPSTFQDLLRIFRSIAKTSPQLSFELIKLDLIDIFYQILTGASFSPDHHATTTFNAKWRDSIPTIMKTIADILPPLPKGGTFSSRRFKSNSVASRTRSSTTGLTTDEAIDPRIEWLTNHTQHLTHLDQVLIPLLSDLYGSTVNPQVRLLITHTLVKLLHFSSPEILLDVLKNVSLSSFLSNIIVRQEYPACLINALYLVEILVEKLPDIYLSLFKREGVLHEIENLAKLSYQDQPSSSKVETTEPTSEKEPSQEGSSDEGDDDPKSSLERILQQIGSQSNRAAGIFDTSELQLLTRHRYLKRPDLTETGLGRGFNRKYIILLARDLVDHPFQKDPSDTDNESIRRLIKTLWLPSKSKSAVAALSRHLRQSDLGISSYELIHTGLMTCLLDYLSQPRPKFPLEKRQAIFRSIEHESHKKLVTRLQEIVSQYESFEVVTPLESIFSLENERHPTSALAKQLRIRLKAKGDHVPAAHQQMMVSVHAVATFQVLEEYLLTRLKTNSIDSDSEEEGLVRENSMEIDENPREGPADTEMTDVESSQHDTQNTSTVDPVTQTEESSNPEDKRDGENGDWKIRFSLNDTIIPNASTIYAAIHQYERNVKNNASSEGASSSSNAYGRPLFSSLYPITFERIWLPKNQPEPNPPSPSPQQFDDLKDNPHCRDAIELLKVLSSLIQSPKDFYNPKLTAKVNRQLEEPLIVASACLPSWVYGLMRHAAFLFPFETRYLFIQSTSFGYARLISRWQSIQMRNNIQNSSRNHHLSDRQQPALGQMERQKVRIARDQMLESAIKILEMFGSSPSVLEIEYMGEEGTGMGPTLEFYAATSKAFCQHALNMWRGSNPDDKEGYVDGALFPKTLPSGSDARQKKIIQLFKTLGQFMAKGLLDFRIIDIPFSPAFFNVVLDPSGHRDLELLGLIDPQLASSIKTVQSFSLQKQQLDRANKSDAQENTKSIQDITVDGVKIEDLALDFTLPGDHSCELKTNGSEISVTIHNVEEYIELVKDKIMGSGIAQQISAFRDGFNQSFSIDDLKLLTSDELVVLFGKAEEDWSFDCLANAIRADHGFSMESAPVKYLLEILSEFDLNQRRQFLQFTTGSPRLPIGGWKSLWPVFTVVCKIPEAPLTPDDYLPSVMTCANYLKMPSYSSKEILLEKLKISMTEGQNSFLLS